MSVAAISGGVGIAHLPNQRHKIVSKRGANFTLMVCGKVKIVKFKIKKKGTNLCLLRRIWRWKDYLCKYLVYNWHKKLQEYE